MTEDEMVGWHHRLDGHEFEQASGVADGRGILACCGLWGRKDSETTKKCKSTAVKNNWRQHLTWDYLLN